MGCRASTAELAAAGLRCGRERVARLMRRAGLVGAHRRHQVTTTRRDPAAELWPDLIQRTFRVPAPDQFWVADITDVPTWDGFLYLAVVLAVFSRRIVGWSMADHMRTELAVDALQMALGRRRPPAGLIHHSDRGSQYTATAFSAYCRAANIRCSMGSVGDYYDNALAESFFATLECELLTVEAFRTQHPGSRRPLRVHRVLLQSASAPFGAGLSLAPRV